MLLLRFDREFFFWPLSGEDTVNRCVFVLFRRLRRCKLALLGPFVEVLVLLPRACFPDLRLILVEARDVELVFVLERNERARTGDTSYASYSYSSSSSSWSIS